MHDWHRRCRQSQRVQYDSGTRYGRIDQAMTITDITLSIFLGSGLFYILTDGQNGVVKAATGALGVLGLVCSILQALLRYDLRAAEHRRLSAEYGSVRRDLELLAARCLDAEDKLVELRSIQARMDKLAERSLPVPPRVKARAVPRLDESDRSSGLFVKVELDQDISPAEGNLV